MIWPGVMSGCDIPDILVNPKHRTVAQVLYYVFFQISRCWVNLNFWCPHIFAVLTFLPTYNSLTHFSITQVNFNIYQHRTHINDTSIITCHHYHFDLTSMRTDWWQLTAQVINLFFSNKLTYSHIDDIVTHINHL